MNSEIFSAFFALPDLFWQSTLFITVGLLCSFIIRHRSARAYQVLLLSLITAATVPGMSALVRHLELGILTPKPTVQQPIPANIAPIIYQETTSIVSAAKEAHHKAILESTESIIPKNIPQATVIPWRKILFYGWFIVTLVLLSRLIISFVQGVQLLNKSVHVDCDKLKKSIQQAKARLGIDIPVEIYSSDSVTSPMIWCWRSRPVLLIPVGIERSNERIDWTSVLCHELAHWKRRDHISGLLTELIICIFPWHLLLWWAKFRLIRLSEQACDDWVIATSQSGTDYAESLLDLIPSRQMAFVPAVVNSKKGLASRIRRILKENCGNPQTSILWALTANTIAACLAVGVAFAQTKPSQPTGTIKTRLSQSAAIEQLASATIIKGRILDSNNEPTFDASIIAMPMTSYAVTTDKKGYFELPWSPTYIDKGKPICLIAIHDLKNEATVIEIKDSTLPATIYLKPACTLTGKIVDTNGQPLSSSITLSMDRSFKIKAPIFHSDTHHYHIDTSMQGKFILNSIPYNQTYKLNIRDEGYKPVEIAIDTKNTTKKELDIGTIFLQQHDRTKSIAAEQFSNPDLEKEFNEVYCLKNKEIIKLVKPPFVLGHQQYLPITSDPSHRSISFGLQVEGGFQFRLIWDGGLKETPLCGFLNTVRPVSLEDVFRVILRIPYYDFGLPKEQNISMPFGDWIIQDGSTVEEQLKALEKIIHAEKKRVIRFNKRSIGERDTIIVTGRYSFKPLSEKYKDVLCIYIDKENIPPLFTTVEKNSLSELLRSISEEINIPIEDRTEPVEITKIRYVSEHDLLMPFRSSWQKDRQDKMKKKLPILLDNLAKQTGLKFTIERRPAEIWFVTEKKDG